MQTDPPSSYEPHIPTPRTAEVDSFEALADKLRAIGARAIEVGWAGWSDADTEAIAAAAAEIEGIRAALAEGMRQAFEIGREYGHREELLDRVNAEISEVSSRLARQAWGRAGRASSGANSIQDGSPDG